MDYWILSASTLHHNGQEKRVDFNLESLKAGQTVGCCVNREGELRYFINGMDQGVAWTGLPTDRPMWGFADIYGLARKIKSEFLFGEFVKWQWSHQDPPATSDHECSGPIPRLLSGFNYCVGVYSMC